MTMHMAHPGLNTLNTAKRKKKPSVKQRRATADHESWLRTQGLHPEQLAARQPKTATGFQYRLSVDRNGPQCTNGFAPGGSKNSVFDSQWRRTYEDDPLLDAREQEALRKADALKSKLMPLYNKGPVQLQTNGTNLKDGNGRGRS